MNIKNKETNESNVKKGKKYIIAIIALIIIFVIIFIAKYINDNSAKNQNILQEKISNSIVEMDYYNFIESAEKMKDNNIIWDKLIQGLKEIEEKVKNNPNENDFNLINNFIDKMVSNENNYFSEENINAIKNQKKRIDYFYYIKIADAIIETEESYSVALLNYRNAMNLVKENDEYLYNESKTKFSITIEKANQELLSGIQKYIDKDDYNGGYEYLEIHNEEIRCIVDSVLFEKYAKEEYKMHINIPTDENGDCELFNKEMIVYSKINEEQRKIKEQKEAEEKAKKKQEGVRIGMSKQDVLDSIWGKPIKKNITTNKYGTREQWVYSNYNYLYFENDKLVSIQTSE